MINVAKSVVLLVLFQISLGADAQVPVPRPKPEPRSILQCPIRNQQELIMTKPLDQPVKTLTTNEVIEDLLCLKDLFENFYAAQLYYPDVDLANRIDKLIEVASPMNNQQLMERAFALTDDIYDLHLRFMFANTLLKDESQSTKTVKVTPDLAPEETHAVGKAYYFKPGNLYGDLTEPQRNFAGLLASSNGDFIVDMTGNDGGDNDFAFALVRSLYQPSEHVPTNERIQANSPLIWRGLLNLFQYLGYRGLEDFEKQVKESWEGITYQQALNYTLKTKLEKIIGERQSKYKGKTIILIDGKCSSACETVIEKLQPHPNVELVGQNSAGALHFSNAMTFLLPHSKVLVSIPTLFHKMENDAPEGIGYTPDVITETVNLNDLF